MAIWSQENCNVPWIGLGFSAFHLWLHNYMGSQANRYGASGKITGVKSVIEFAEECAASSTAALASCLIIFCGCILYFALSGYDIDHKTRFYRFVFYGIVSSFPAFPIHSPSATMLVVGMVVSLLGYMMKVEAAD